MANESTMKERILPMELKRRRKAARKVASHKVSESDILGSEKDYYAAQCYREGEILDSKSEQEAIDTSSPNILSQNAVIQSAKKSSAEKQNRLSDWFSANQLKPSKKRQNRRAGPCLDIPTTFKSGNRIPFDITPRDKIVLLTSSPLPFSKIKTCTQFCAMRDLNRPIQDSGLDSERLWFRSLHYYTYSSFNPPYNATPKSNESMMLSNHYPEKSNIGLFAERYQQWQVSFRNAYFCFRNGCSLGGPDPQLFYIQASEFLVCFYKIADPKDAELSSDSISANSILSHLEDLTLLPKCEHEHQNLCALMTRSNARIRKELLQKDIQFSVPFDTSTLTKNHYNNEDITVSGPDSALYFYGHLQVHGLYEFLLNKKPLSNQEMPTLFALYPFTNATIQKLDVKFLGKVANNSTQNGKSFTDATCLDVYRTEISGFCFPQTLQTLLHITRQQLVAKVATTSKFEVLLQSLLQSQRLNTLFLPTQVILKPGSETSLQSLELAKQQMEKITYTEKSKESNVFKISLADAR